MAALDLSDLPNATIVAHYRAEDYTSGSWPDRTVNGYDLAEATNPPTAVADGGSDFNNKPVVRFDGTNDVIKRATTPSLSQPYTYIVIGKITANTATVQSIISDAAGSSPYMGVDASEALRMFAGTSNLSGATNLLDVPAVLEGLFNGASSVGRVNYVTEATGNPGSATSAGISIGLRGDGSLPAGMDVAEAIVIDGALTHADRVYLAQYAEQHYGLALPYPQTASPTTTTAGAGTSVNANLPATKQGELQLLLVSRPGLNLATQPGGWQQLAALSNNAADNVSGSIFSRVAPADSAATTQTISASGSAAWAVHAYNVSMWDGTYGNVTISADAAGFSSGPNPNSVSLNSLAKSLVIAAGMAGDDGAAFNGFPSGYTGGVSTVSSSTCSIGTARKEVQASSDDPGTFSVGAPSVESWVSWAVGVPGVAAVPLTASGAGIMAGGF